MGEHGLGAFEGLDLALLVDAKHHCLLERIEIYLMATVGEPPCQFAQAIFINI
jgi:hypothetical protein